MTPDRDEGRVVAWPAAEVEEAHHWRTRRSCRGELGQWDTRTHDWLEGAAKQST